MSTTRLRKLRNRLSALLVGIATFASAGLALADPPSRVARLGYISGAVSFSPAGENEWVHGVVNRPLITGDRLWVAPGARAELQIGLAVARLSGSTSVTLLNVDDRVTQLELTQGTLNIRVRRLPPNHVVEIDTPNLAFTLRRPGNYRIEVDPADDATTVLVRDGQGEVFGEGVAYAIAARQSYRYYATGLREYEVIRPQFDDFDRWSAERDRRTESSVALRYVSPDVIGYEDLDANGTWRVVAGYGAVWVPTRVASGWAPYRDGHWSWVEPWGWTWVDDAPWGFAVSHYGRWTNLDGTWGWVPGPVRQQAIYAPALVAFVGGSNFRLSVSSGNVGAVGWFPLGPSEIYRPSYAVSRDYFARVNNSNTVINNINITNVYNAPQNVTYVNQRVPGAVVAVPTTAFVQSQPVARVAVRLSSEQVFSAPVTQVVAVAPIQRSVIGPAAPANRPVVDSPVRQIVARTAPPPPPVPFVARESALAATPGKPLTESEVQRLKPGGAAAVPAPQVVVGAPAKPAVPMAAAQPSQPSTSGPGGQGQGGPGRGRPEPGAPGPDQTARPQPALQAPAIAPAPNGGVPPGQRGRIEPPTAVPQPPAAAPTSVPAPETRIPPGQRGRSEQPGALTPDMAPKPGAAPPPAVAPVEPRPPFVPPGQRGRVEPAPQPPVLAPLAPQPPAAIRPAPPAPVAAPPAPPQRGRAEPTPQPAPQPAPPPVVQPQPAPPAAVAPAAVRPQPQPVPQPPAAAPPEQRVPPGQRGREPQAQPAPAPVPAPAPAARAPEPRPAPPPPVPAQPNPIAPQPAAGAPAKPGAPGADEKRGRDQSKQDEDKRQEEEKKGRRPN